MYLCLREKRCIILNIFCFGKGGLRYNRLLFFSSFAVFMKYLPHFLLTLFVIIADQITKFAVLARFAHGERLNIIPDFFDLILVFNPGAAFSFLADMGGIQKYILTLFAFAICAYLVYGIVKNEFGHWGNFAAAAVIGGALGNVIDRFLHNQVVDFLLFYWNDWYYPAFNVADSFICMGLIVLLISQSKTSRKGKTS